jgi:hypothetical protein
MTDPTKDPLTQAAWEWIVQTLIDTVAHENDDELLEPPLTERIDELIEAIQRLRYNYMAMTMIDVIKNQRNI